MQTVFRDGKSKGVLLREAVDAARKRIFLPGSKRRFEEFQNHFLETGEIPKHYKLAARWYASAEKRVISDAQKAAASTLVVDNAVTLTPREISDTQRVALINSLDAKTDRWRIIACVGLVAAVAAVQSQIFTIDRRFYTPDEVLTLARLQVFGMLLTVTAMGFGGIYLLSHVHERIIKGLNVFDGIKTAQKPEGTV